LVVYPLVVVVVVVTWSNHDESTTPAPCRRSRR
jgi:hypothetical protein